MPRYLPLGIESDASAIGEVGHDTLARQVPGYVPADASVESALIDAGALIEAYLAGLATRVAEDVFAYFGSSLMRLPPRSAASAVASSTWTAVDTDGYTIPEGTQVALSGPEGDVAFEVVGEVVIPPGASATSAGEVQLVAVEPGRAGSGLPGPGAPIDALAWVQAITLTAPTIRGEDAEPMADYLDRLSGDELTLLAPRPILPGDFARMARRVAGVDRAVAIDGLNPADGTTNNERMVAVAAVDAQGEPLAALVKAELDALLEGQREVNFVVNVIDPTYTTIDVTFTAVAYSGFIAAEVEAAAEAALAAYLSPGAWGLPRSGDERVWINEPSVRHLELSEVINRTEGVHYITALTLGPGGGAQAAANLGLAGNAPLVRPGAINGTVTGGS